MNSTDKAIESLLASQKRQLRGRYIGTKAFKEFFKGPYPRGSSLNRGIVSDSEDDQATPDSSSTTSA
ncbi:hypothetical protein HK096_000595 [Nowakowskiella sp. JEL0078]|nr:hypothetical protein HK096_000595 [Nowakowskiella sp. JEL0078]